MNDKQVVYFLQIVETGSFSAAAEELYISQSSLSKQINALEKELSVQLFDRSRRKIQITPAGEVFLKHARLYRQTFQKMLAELSEFKEIPSCSIIAIPVIAQYGITAYIANFRNTHPDIQLELEEREASDVLPALDSHQFDFAFLRDNYLDREQYISLEVTQDELLVVLSHHHPLATRASISLTELTAENFIMFDKGTVVHELAVDACRKAGFEPRIFYASLRVESILGLVASQAGIALMMKKVFEYRKHPEVIAIPLVESVPSKIILAHPKEKKLTTAARAFWTFMQNQTSLEQGFPLPL